MAMIPCLSTFFSRQSPIRNHSAYETSLRTLDGLLCASLKITQGISVHQPRLLARILTYKCKIKGSNDRNFDVKEFPLRFWRKYCRHNMRRLKYITEGTLEQSGVFYYKVASIFYFSQNTISAL